MLFSIESTSAIAVPTLGAACGGGWGMRYGGRVEQTATGTRGTAGIT